VTTAELLTRLARAEGVTEDEMVSRAVEMYYAFFSEPYTDMQQGLRDEVAAFKRGPIE